MSAPGGGWVFLGHGPMGAAALEAMASRSRPCLVIAAPRAYGAGEVWTVAEAHGLEVRRTRLVNEDRGVREAVLVAGAGVTCGWNERLREPLLSAPRCGWLNLHPSRLPSWRGADPVAWQLVTRATEIGCSVHRMTEEFDSGPVVASCSVAVRDGDDRGTAVVRAGRALGRLAAGVVEALSSGGALPAEPQRDGASSWCPPLGVSLLLDSTRLTARQALRVVAAFSPQPGVAVVQLGSGVRVARARVVEAAPGPRRPGTVHDAGGGVFVVSFRDADVRVERCEARRTGLLATS